MILKLNKIYNTETGMPEVGAYSTKGKNEQYKSIMLYFSTEAEEYFLHIVHEDHREEIVPVIYEDHDFWLCEYFTGRMSMGQIADAALEKRDTEHVGE
jgi:hypothetical protein